MYQKKQELAMNRENPKKIYTIETKIVIAFSAAQVRRKKGDKKREKIAISY